MGWFDTDIDGDGMHDTSHAFLYDPDVLANQAFDLNEIVAGIPDGWEIRKATAINSIGDIAAYLKPVAPNAQDMQAAMIDMNALPPQLHVIDDSAFTDYSVTRGMNDLGDIMVSYEREDQSRGVYVYNFGFYDESLESLVPIDLGINSSYGLWYEINNARQIAGEREDGTPFRYTIGGTFETFPDLLSADDINDSGVISGWMNFALNRKGTQTERRPYVMGEELDVINGTNQGLLLPVRLNEDADFITRHDLYHQSWGLLDPRDLLDPNDPDAAILQNSDAPFYLLNDRDDTTNFPQVFGVYADVNANLLGGVVLTPVPVP